MPIVVQDCFLLSCILYSPSLTAGSLCVAVKRSTFLRCFGMWDIAVEVLLKPKTDNKIFLCCNWRSWGGSSGLFPLCQFSSEEFLCQGARRKDVVLGAPPSVGVWTPCPFLLPENFQCCHPTCYVLLYSGLGSHLHFIYNPPILTPWPPVQLCKGAQQLNDLLCYKNVKSRSQAANAGNCIQAEPWFDTSGYWM